MKSILNSFEQGLNYTERRMINLVHQVLNQTVNFLQIKENLTDLFRVYSDVLKDKTKPDFHKSLDTTISCCKDFGKFENALKSLEDNNPDSFVIVPLMAYGHMFSSVFRKIDGAFSATIVNKGDRYIDDQFVEYLFNNNQILTVSKELAKENGNAWITDIYKIFQENSFATFSLNIESREQKIGNCFIKEPENSIKFAFATRRFDKNRFISLRNNHEFSSKWENSTLEIHKKFVDKVAAENPRIAGIIKNEFKNYAVNKRFRENYEFTRNLDEALVRTFVSAEQNFNPKTEAGFKNVVSNLDLESIRMAYYALENKLNSLPNDNTLMKKSLDFIYETSKNNTDLYGELNSVSNKLENAYKYFPFATKQIAYYCHENLFTVANNKKKFESEFWRILAVSESIYSYNHHLECFKGAFLLDKALKNSDDSSKNDLKVALNYFNRSIELCPDYPNAFYLRSIALMQLGDYVAAKNDFEKSQQLKPGSANVWEKQTPLAVFNSFFRSIQKQQLHNAKPKISRNFTVSHSQANTKIKSPRICHGDVSKLL